MGAPSTGTRVGASPVVCVAGWGAGAVPAFAAVAPPMIARPAAAAAPTASATRPLRPVRMLESLFMV
jgi:hypothetical protein